MQAELARENGLIVAAEVAECDEDEDDPYPWRAMATVLWAHGDILPTGSPKCAVRLAIGTGITVSDGNEERHYDKQVVSEMFIPYFLQGLLEGQDPFSIAASYES